MYSVVVIKYTGCNECRELELWKQNGAVRNSRHRQHFLGGSLPNHELIQILHELKTTLRFSLPIGEDIVLLDEGSEFRISGRKTSRILPLASRHILPAS